MNFTQMRDRLCQELLRRIQRGTLSVSLLSRKSGLGQSHLSNFLRKRRQLSLSALDKVLSAQYLDMDDLAPLGNYSLNQPAYEKEVAVPIVSHATAIYEPNVRAAAVQSMLPLPDGVLKSLKSRATPARQTWQRFVAVRLSAPDARPMAPFLCAAAVVLIDRHYNSLTAYRPDQKNIYAIRHGSQLCIRYAELAGQKMILRPHNPASKVELLDVSDCAPAEFLAGRVAMALNEI